MSLDMEMRMSLEAHSLIQRGGIPLTIREPFEPQAHSQNVVMKIQATPSLRIWPSPLERCIQEPQTLALISPETLLVMALAF